ncbi:MAG: HlyC/CorC family transporter [Candidatus Krumholzibacteria bacterium]|nr:HlyC/CorC family transporter [Candidatus Krumholzibacteria bacterium]
MDDLLLYVVALAVLLALSAFFSGSEAALYSLTRPQIRSLGNRSPAGRLVGRLLEKPRKLLISILLGNLLVNIFATSTVTKIMLDTFGEKGLGYAFLVMSALILTFGEIFPKVVALHWSERFSTVVIVPLRVFHAFVTPVRVPLSWISDAVIGRLRRRIGQRKKQFTWDELITAVQISRTSGAVGSFEYEVLSNVLEFREKIVKEIMTPSIDVVSRPAASSRDDLVRTFLENGMSRVPIWGETTDDIIGVLHIKDILEPSTASGELALRALLREPFFIPETALINELYNELQRRKAHIAVVIDEYASFVGIVTIEDILEELVGEIRDARDPKIDPYMWLDGDRIVVPGTMEIDEFNRVFNTGIEDEDHETVAGHLIGITGRIPREGEVFESEGLRFCVISAQPNRIRKMRVERVKQAERS